MDYEKKYKEALEMAKVAALNGHQNLMEGIFPELRESEDEKIRKMLIDSFTRADMGGEIYGKGVTYKQVLAWLEKQGSEPNWCHHKVDLSNCSEEYRKAYYDGWNNCNMQHSQCAWSEEDERIINKILCICNDFERSFEMSPLSIKVIKEDVDKIDNWLLSIKKRIGG